MRQAVVNGLILYHDPEAEVEGESLDFTKMSPQGAYTWGEVQRYQDETGLWHDKWPNHGNTLKVTGVARAHWCEDAVEAILWQLIGPQFARIPKQVWMDELSSVIAYAKDRAASSYRSAQLQSQGELEEIPFLSTGDTALDAQLRTLYRECVMRYIKATQRAWSIAPEHLNLDAQYELLIYFIFFSLSQQREPETEETTLEREQYASRRLRQFISQHKALGVQIQGTLSFLSVYTGLDRNVLLVIAVGIIILFAVRFLANRLIRRASVRTIFLTLFTTCLVVLVLFYVNPFQSDY